MNIDLWYGNTLKECDNYNWRFSDCDLVYRGNIYIDGKAVGDFTAPTLQDFYDLWKKAHAE